MQRRSAILGSLLFFFVAPATIAGLVPWGISHWRVQASFFGLALVRVAGATLIAIGVPVLLESFARFALQGQGTPAPVAPPRHLVVTGSYRYVRNPIYLAVTAIVLGQGLLFGDGTLLVYGALLALGFHIFVLVYEEPTLRQTFGAQFEAYTANVPRWAPRLQSWTPDAS